MDRVQGPQTRFLPAIATRGTRRPTLSPPNGQCLMTKENSAIGAACTKKYVQPTTRTTVPQTREGRDATGNTGIAWDTARGALRPIATIAGSTLGGLCGAFLGGAGVLGFPLSRENVRSLLIDGSATGIAGAATLLVFSALVLRNKRHVSALTRAIGSFALVCVIAAALFFCYVGMIAAV